MSEQGGSNRRAIVLGVILLIVCALAVVVLSSRTATGEPFDADSAAPDGYAALVELLRQRGATVRRSTFDRVAADPPRAGDVVFVPAPGLATKAERTIIESAAGDGAVVVWGEVPEDALEFLVTYPPDDLAETPAEPREPGLCDVPELDGLGAIDVAFSFGGAFSEGASTCYGHEGAPAQVVVREVGHGRVVTLGSPYLLVNARLQPDKENGGEPLDNAAMALRLMGSPPDGTSDGTRVTFVEARRSTAADDAGQRSVIDLLPTPVKLAVVQGFGAFVIYAWWRSRRLGAPVREKVPVEVAGSELVVAVGDLLRRRGSADAAAADVRAGARRTLAGRLGVPPSAPPSALVDVVAARTGRPPGEVDRLLGDHPVSDTAALIRLARDLDQLRQEVLDEQPVG